MEEKKQFIRVIYEHGANFIERPENLESFILGELDGAGPGEQVQQNPNMSHCRNFLDRKGAL